MCFIKIATAVYFTQTANIPTVSLIVPCFQVFYSASLFIVGWAPYSITVLSPNTLCQAGILYLWIADINFTEQSDTGEGALAEC